MKRKVKFENYKNCLVATQPENKINYLGKYNIGEDSIKENHKISLKAINQYQKYSKGLTVKRKMCSLKNLTRLP